MNTTRPIFPAIAAIAIPAIVLSAATDGFKTSINLGGTLTDGNSVTRQLNAALTTEGEKEGFGSVRAGSELNYGESTVDGKKATTVNNARLWGEAKRMLNDKVFGYLNASLLHDDAADVAYRAMVGPGLGVYLIKNDRMSLEAETGATYVWEEVSGAADDSLAVRFAERCERKLGDAAKAWQALEFLPKVDDFGDYLLSAELGVEAAVNTRMSLRIVLQDKYDSTPGEGMKDNDLTLIAGVGFKL